MVDAGNKVQGVLTRKDLMGHALEEQILGEEVYTNTVVECDALTPN